MVPANLIVRPRPGWKPRGSKALDPAMFRDIPYLLMSAGLEFFCALFAHQCTHVFQACSSPTRVFILASISYAASQLSQYFIHCLLKIDTDRRIRSNSTRCQSFRLCLPPHCHECNEHFWALPTEPHIGCLHWTSQHLDSYDIPHSLHHISLDWY